MSKGLVITVSFQQSEKWLYDILSAKSSRSGTIKDILKEYYQGKEYHTEFDSSNTPSTLDTSSILDSF